MMLSNDPYHAMLATAVQAARLAGQKALACRDTVRASIKNNSEMVTEADRLCQNLIVEHLRAAYPDHGFMGEEGDAGTIFKQPPQAVSDTWWIIDPIDGTNNYAHGLPQFSVSIAAMQQGHPVVGVIYDPSTDQMFTAVNREPPQENGRLLAVSDETLSKYSSVGIDSHFGDTVPDWLCEIMVGSRFRNLGTTALHLAYTAKGALAGTVLFIPKLWDIAAGFLIAANAGALVTDWSGQSIWPINPADYQGGMIPSVIGNPPAHAQMLAWIQNKPQD